MDDLISRAVFRSSIQTVLNDTTCPIHIAAEIEQYLELEPAVDAVPVIRCRDCKHGEPTKNARDEAVIKCKEICWLCRLPRLMEPDWYCADGERRDNNGTDA
jgi:hypothetical protein